MSVLRSAVRGVEYRLGRPTGAASVNLGPLTGHDAGGLVADRTRTTPLLVLYAVCLGARCRVRLV